MPLGPVDSLDVENVMVLHERNCSFCFRAVRTLPGPDEVVEWFFAWISRSRRLWKDAEAAIESATTFLYEAAVMILVRRITRYP